MTMQQAIYRIGWMTLTAFLVWVFHQPGYLAMLIIMPWLGRVKTVNKTMKEHFDDIRERIDCVAQSKMTPQTQSPEVKELNDKLDKLLKFNAAQYLTEEEKRNMAANP